jgi:hypothetical protein
MLRVCKPSTSASHESKLFSRAVANCARRELKWTHDAVPSWPAVSPHLERRIDSLKAPRRVIGNTESTTQPAEVVRLISPTVDGCRTM